MPKDNALQKIKLHEPACHIIGKIKFALGRG